MIISVDSEKQEILLANYKNEFLQWNKGLCQTPTANITFNGEIWKLFNLKLVPT